MIQPFSAYEAYVRPYWLGGEILRESVFPVSPPNHDGGPLRIPLLHRIGRVAAVQSAVLDRTFVPGRDYAVEDGELVIPPGSAIPVLPWARYNPAEDTGFPCRRGGFLLFHEGQVLHRMQCAVTYTADGNAFAGRDVPVPSPALAGVRARPGGRLRLAFYGDSITCGCNASGLGEGAPPYMPIYPQLVAGTLRRRGWDVDCCNPSVGGMTSDWGRDHAARLLGDFRPMLTVVAFGMNDGAALCPADRFAANIRAMVETLRALRPGAACILVSPILANPLSTYDGLQETYAAPLAALAAELDCAFLDMTALHRTLLARKAWHHMTGNNINHPNDFLARLYAQGILALLGL